ncbi:MAG TPA: flavin reductase family protein [Pseudonocardiaceae bacterium]|jgi:flavin reductase (DIM6/NTAB) family NADH-FMN oxidoreductase RutF|nr:flavin reductase family protein [Pseudonocardiaceae bacterium]
MTEMTTRQMFPVVHPVTGTATEGFRAMMCRFPTGVAIVTTIDDDGVPRGMTCSSVCSVTLDPPTLLVCLRTGSPTLDAILRSGTFAVNLLHDRAQEVAQLFASGNPDRFDLVDWTADPTTAGPHLVADAHTIADCDVARTEVVGDHVVVFGETHTVTERHGPPLLYGLRDYHAWPGR